MTSEVVKKRGRPKKVISESISGENMEQVKKATVRQKSTKASAPPAATSNKSAKLSAATPEDISVTSTVGKKISEKSKNPTVAAKTSSSTQTTSPDAMPESLPVPPNTPAISSPPKITPANSKILNQVRAISSKTPAASKPSPSLKSPTPPPASTATASSKAAKAFPQTNTTKQSALTSSTRAPPQKSEPEPLASFQAKALKASSPLPQQPSKSIPIAALNSSIVSEISSRAGARPSRPLTELPATYKPTARKVTMVIIALPIAIVTSWVLYERREF